MLTVHFTHDYLEGEPGPNFYWRGTISDIMDVITRLHPLGINNDITIFMNAIPNVTVTGNYKVLLKSYAGGNILCGMSIDNIIVQLDCSVWRRVLTEIFQLSFYPSHAYIEFDDLQLSEDANFIVSSEATVETGDPLPESTIR